MEDPTEQKNLINDTEQAARVAAMRQTLSLQVQTFFTNKDSFENDCPADLDPEKDSGLDHCHQIHFHLMESAHSLV